MTLKDGVLYNTFLGAKRQWLAFIILLKFPLNSHLGPENYRPNWNGCP